MTVLQFLSQFGTEVMALVIVLDPFAIMPMLIALMVGGDPREGRRLIYKVVGSATVLLLFFTVTGVWVLQLFGATVNDLRIGGGLLLLIISLRMVVEGRIGPRDEDHVRAAVVPLISPLLVGPGAITAAVVLAGIHGVLITALAGLAAMAICLLLFLSTRFVYRLLGDSGTELVTRIMGILIATIAVNYIRVGVTNILRALGVV